MKFLIVLALCAVAASAKPTRADGPAEGEYEPIHVGPAIVDGEYEDISVGPAIVDDEYEPISVGPAIVDESVVGASSPLVQIIVNVNPPKGQPVIKPDPIDFDDIFGPPAVVHDDDDEPSPIIIVDEPEPQPEPKPEPQPEEPVPQPDVKPEPQPDVDIPTVVLPGVILTK